MLGYNSTKSEVYSLLLLIWNLYQCKRGIENEIKASGRWEYQRRGSEDEM